MGDFINIRGRFKLRRRACDEKSWKPDPDREKDTRPADNVQIVLTSVAGPSTPIIQHSRSQSWTASMNVGFPDVVSLGVGFEMTETSEDSESYIFSVPAGQTGDVGFTAYLVCTLGKSKKKEPDL